MKRSDGRQFHELRKIHFTPHAQKDPAGSVLVEWGLTRVLCSVMVEERSPPWMPPGQRTGWITAEYVMLPGSSDKRISRDKSRNNGRTHEIQRLIGRSLRTCVDLAKIGEKTLQIDCDVLQADGGTRVASITGAYLALRLAMHKWRLNVPAIAVAAVSLGIVDGRVLTDLNYSEDSTAEVDSNLVMNERGEFIELQSTAERASFTRAQWDSLLSAGEDACRRVLQIQKGCLLEWGIS